MGGTFVKLLIGAFFVALSSQVGELAREVIGKARESVQATELMTLDGQLWAWSVEQRRTRPPRDQAEFEAALRDVLAARGERDVTRDRWGQPYAYERLNEAPVRWRITSRGADRRLGSADDLVVERRGDAVERNRDPVAIAEAAIARKLQSERQVVAELRSLADGLGGRDVAAEAPVDLKAAEQAQREATLAELDRLLGAG